MTLISISNGADSTRDCNRQEIKDAAKNIIIDAKSKASTIKTLAAKERDRADREAGTITAQYHNDQRKRGIKPDLGTEPPEATEVREKGRFRYEELRMKADEVMSDFNLPHT